MGVEKKAGESQLFQLAQQAVEDGKRWFPNSVNLPHQALGLCGEAGEFANLVKKLDRGSLDIKDPNVRYKLMMELTDVFTYTLECAGILGLDLERSYGHIRSKNEERFGKHE